MKHKTPDMINITGKIILKWYITPETIPAITRNTLSARDNKASVLAYSSFFEITYKKQRTIATITPCILESSTWLYTNTFNNNKIRIISTAT